MSDQDERLTYLNMANPMHLFAVGFGIGLKFKKPGTMASLLMLPLCLLFIQLSILIKIILLLFFFGICLLACKSVIDLIGYENKNKIACDEFLGMLVSVMFLNADEWFMAVVAFFVFRFFAMMRPFPISLIQKKIPPFCSVVVDDFYCGLLTALTTWIIGMIIFSNSYTAGF